MNIQSNPHASYVGGAARRVAFQIPASQLLDRVTSAADRDQVSPDAALAVNADSTDLRPVKDGAALKEGERLLPLRMGALRGALEKIGQTDSWLLSDKPVLYLGGDQYAHIDFVNLAGFAVAPHGAIIWRSVNPA